MEGVIMMNKKLKVRVNKENSSLELKKLELFNVLVNLDEVNSMIALRLPEKVLGKHLEKELTWSIINITDITTPLNLLLYAIAELKVIPIELNFDMHKNMQYDTDNKVFNRELTENDIINSIVDEIEKFVAS